MHNSVLLMLQRGVLPYWIRLNQSQKKKSSSPIILVFFWLDSYLQSHLKLALYFAFRELESALNPFIVNYVIHNKLKILIILCDIFLILLQSVLPYENKISQIFPTNWYLELRFKINFTSILWQVKSSMINYFVYYLFMLHLQDSIWKMVNTIKIEKLIGKNSFKFWCIKTRALLKEHVIWAPFFGQSSKIDKLVLELQQEKTNSLILLSLSNEFLYEVSKELTVVRLRL